MRSYIKYLGKFLKENMYVLYKRIFKKFFTRKKSLCNFIEFKIKK